MVKTTITLEEWQLLGQVMIDITENTTPSELILESAVLYEWYRDETGKFQFPKTRKQQWKRISIIISLVRVLRWMPDNWQDTYWQIIKKGLLEKLNQAVRNPTLQLNV